jgi:type IV secretory pathway TraG/TraD family ATPase VirD4
MAVFALLFGGLVAVGVNVFNYKMLVRRFVKLGIPAGVFKSYLVNRLIYNKIGLKFRMEAGPLVGRLSGMGSRGRIGRQRYNRVVEAFFKGQREPAVRGVLEESTGDFLRVLGVSVYIGLGVALAYIVVFCWKSRKYRQEDFIRGARIMSGPEFGRSIRRFDRDSLSIRVGELSFPRKLELMHTMCYGTTGSGKSNLTGQYIDNILRRRQQRGLNERLMIYDIKGEFTGKFYTHKDILFYPFDRRSVRWSFFNELWEYPDLEIYAKKLFAVPDKRNEYWYNAAKDVFTMILVHLWISKARQGIPVTNGDIANFVSLPLKAIVNKLQELPQREQAALKHINRLDSNQAANIISILVERTSFFKYLVGLDGDFSFRRFIREGFQDKNIFLLNLSKYSPLFKPIMTYVIDVMISEVLTKPDLDDLNGERTFFIIDEINSLFMMESLIDFVTQSRVKGGALWATAQGPFKLMEIYGRELFYTIDNNFNTLVAFRLNNPESAEFVSKSFGQIHKTNIHETRSVSPHTTGDRETLNRQDRVETLILPSEIQGLNNHRVFVKMANVGITRLQIPFRKFEAKEPHFASRDFNEAFWQELEEALEEVREEREKVNIKEIDEL